MSGSHGMGCVHLHSDLRLREGGISGIWPIGPVSYFQEFVMSCHVNICAWDRQALCNDQLNGKAQFRFLSL